MVQGSSLTSSSDSVNNEAYETFWHFINERHQVYINKTAGLPKPWTDDPILQEWKFCNVFRYLDKTSDWLIKNILEPHRNANLGNMLFNIMVFRAFNWVPTYETLLRHFARNGWLETWDLREVIDVLKNYVVFQDKQLISGAYMIRGYEGQAKWRSIPEALLRVYEDRFELASEINYNQRLEQATKMIVGKKYWGWGPFMAYQAALDFSYTPILSRATDINTWCHFGPGAQKGLKLIWPSEHELTDLQKGIYLLRQQSNHLKDHVALLNLQDIEFALCELQKYWRIKQGGKMKEKYPGHA